MRSLIIFFFAFFLISANAFAEDGKPVDSSIIPDLSGTPWQGMTVPAGTKIKTEEHDNGKTTKWLILPSGVWINEKDAPLDICEKQCWGIAQDIAIGDKKFSFTRTEKREKFEPLISRLSAVSLKNDISDRKKFFTDKGWDSYQIYVALVRKLFPDILAENFESAMGFLDGTQKYYYVGKWDYLTFHAFGRFNFGEIASSDFGSLRSLMDRALFEIHVNFLPVDGAEKSYVIDSWEVQMFPKKW